MLEVSRYTDVCVEQIVLSIFERDPGLVEEHVLVRHPEFFRKQPSLRDSLHLGHVRVRVLDPQEEETHVRVLNGDFSHSPDQRSRIEPVVDSTAPDDHLVVDADAGRHAADRRPGLYGVRTGNTEGRHRDQGIKFAVP